MAVLMTKLGSLEGPSLGVSGGWGEPTGRVGLRQPGRAEPVGREMAPRAYPSSGSGRGVSVDVRTHFAGNPDHHPDNHRAFPRAYAVRTLTYLGSNVWLCAICDRRRRVRAACPLGRRNKYQALASLFECTWTSFTRR